MARTDPRGQRKRAFPARRINIGQDKIDRERAVAIGEQLSRFVSVGDLDYTIAALPQVFGKRMPHKNVSIDDQNPG